MSGNSDILTAIRSLMLLWTEVTDYVDTRIRPEAFHADDEQLDAIKLELSDGDQQNFLDRSGALIDGNLIITVRSQNVVTVNAIAEAIRSRGTDPSTGLDGYSGSAGTGTLLSAERISFATDHEVDEDGDETDNYLSVQAYQVLFKLGG